jgi:hypothetical protein
VNSLRNHLAPPDEGAKVVTVHSYGDDIVFAFGHSSVSAVDLSVGLLMVTPNIYGVSCGHEPWKARVAAVEIGESVKEIVAEIVEPPARCEGVIQRMRR